MYFEKTYEEYITDLHIKWFALVIKKQKEGTPFKSISFRAYQNAKDIFLQNNNGDYIVYFNHCLRTEEVSYSKEIRQVTIHKEDSYRISYADHRHISFEREVRALLLLAFAFEDEDAIKILKFFLQVATEPEIEFAYIMSERYPAPVKEVKVREEPAQRVVTLPYHERTEID